MEEHVFDWKDTNNAILFLVKESKKGSDVYWIDIGDDTLRFITCQQPTTEKEIKQFIIDSYKKIDVDMKEEYIKIIA